MSVQDRRSEIDYRLRSLDGKVGRKRLLERYAEIENRLREKLEERYADNPPTRDLYSILRVIYQCAENRGDGVVRFVKTEFRRESRSKGYVEHPIVFEVSCTYPRLAEFVADLERYPQWMRIDAVSVQVPSQGGGKVNGRLLVTCIVMEGSGG
ncbi:MAG: type 4a pilus biogenesis protein PilO [Chitinivibrionales bacterium]|nr:type 4a pilus biogenesis protein PilO [Chitinivibrionales bacterium]MBD3358934.1 type 4a pilus biogenesis protein PilO [Chitinivibrionales bacterium]